jgi:hypothetical protein
MGFESSDILACLSVPYKSAKNQMKSTAGLPEMNPAVGSARNQRSTITGVSQRCNGTSVDLESVRGLIRDS